MVSVNCDLVFTVNLTVYVALNRSIYQDSIWLRALED